MMATVLLTPFYENSSPKNASFALKQAIATMAKSQHCAVLWFAEMVKRKLFKNLGYSSIYQYAEVELGFSSTRTGNYLRLAKKLEELPRLKKELEEGKLGYTKGLEVVKVATVENEKQWLEEARTNSRKNLAKKVKLAKNEAAQARKNPEQRPLLPAPKIAAPVVAVKHRIALEMTTEQLARLESLWEKLYKIGGVPVGQGKVDLILQGLAGLVAEAGSNAKPTTAISKTMPPTQIHVHQCPDCKKATLKTGKGEVALAPEELARLECDAKISEPGKPNRSTISPAVRRGILSRDRHHCQGHGCPNTLFLEVHHIVSRQDGGSHKPDNLVTLCSACHQLLHDRKERGLAADIYPPAGKTECT